MRRKKEIDLLKARMQRVETCLGTFIGAHSELARQKRRFLDAEENIMQKLLSELRGQNEHQREPTSDLHESQDETGGEVEDDDASSVVVIEGDSFHALCQSAGMATATVHKPPSDGIQYLAVETYNIEATINSCSEDDDSQDSHLQHSEASINSSNLHDQQVSSNEPPDAPGLEISPSYCEELDNSPNNVSQSSPSHAEADLNTRRFPRRAIKRPTRFCREEIAKSKEQNGGLEGAQIPAATKDAEENNKIDNSNVVPKILNVLTEAYDGLFKLEELNLRQEQLDQLEITEGFNDFGLPGSTIILEPIQLIPAVSTRTQVLAEENSIENHKDSANNISLNQSDEAAPDNIIEDELPAKRKRTIGKVPDNTPQTCSICGKTLSSVHSLVSHMRTHSGTKPYRCSYCSARFSQKSSLTRHVQGHTGDRKHSCDHCDKSFITRYDLLIHSRTHTREPQTCPSCSKNFFDYRYFNSHVKICSDSQASNLCPYCKKRFKDTKYLPKHIRNCAKTAEKKEGVTPTA